MDETGSRQHHTWPTLTFKARREGQKAGQTVEDCIDADDTGLNLNLPCISMAMH